MLQNYTSINNLYGKERTNEDGHDMYGSIGDSSAYMTYNLISE
jgi:hypothetical protein